AAKHATAAIPIVFISGVDPVAAGLVASLRQPAGNLTGLSNFNTQLTAKRIELLHQIVPRAGAIAVLVDPKSPATQTTDAEAEPRAQTVGPRGDCLGAGSEDKIDGAFARMMQRGAGALLVSGDVYFTPRRGQFIALAARHRIPVMYDRKDIAIAGGL